MGEGLIVQSEFATQALAIPDTIDQHLATIETAADAKEELDKFAAMQEYASRIKTDNGVANAIAFGVLKCKAKLGELMPAEKGGRGKTRSAGEPVFSKEAMASYRKLADLHGSGKLDDYYDEIFSSDEPVEVTQAGALKFAANGTSINLSYSGETERYTPVDYIEAARLVMETIDIDPASCKHAQKIVKAGKYFTEKTNGLTKEWNGTVWLNPPYARGLIEKFVEKLLDEVQVGRTTQAVVLVNASTDTGWAQSLLGTCKAVCFPGHRIKFYTESEQLGSPPCGQMFCYFGNSQKLFRARFKEWGICK